MADISLLLMAKHFQFKVEIIAICSLQRILEEPDLQFHWSMADFSNKLIQILDLQLRQMEILLLSLQLEDFMEMLLAHLEPL